MENLAIQNPDSTLSQVENKGPGLVYLTWINPEKVAYCVQQGCNLAFCVDSTLKPMTEMFIL